MQGKKRKNDRNYIRMQCTNQNVDRPKYDPQFIIEIVIGKTARKKQVVSPGGYRLSDSRTSGPRQYDYRSRYPFFDFP